MKQTDTNDDFIKNYAKRLCENRCNYNFSIALEKEILNDVEAKDVLKAVNP